MRYASALPIKRLDPNTPSSVKQVLTLANKYGMEKLRKRIVLHMEGDWPQSLWQWDSLEHEIREMTTDLHESDGVQPFTKSIDDYLPEPASAIRLARDCNIPSILPAAFYHLSRLSVFHDRRKTRLRSNEESYDHSDHLSDDQRSADWNVLSSTDYICLLKGQAKLATVSRELFEVVRFSDYHPDDTCSLSRDLTLLGEMREVCGNSLDVLEASRQYSERKSFGDHVCSNCTRYIRKELRGFRQALWRKLPEYFALA